RKRPIREHRRAVRVRFNRVRARNPSGENTRGVNTPNHASRPSAVARPWPSQRPRIAPDWALPIEPPPVSRNRWNHAARLAVEGAMSTTRFALPVVVILLVAACSAAAAPPSSSPSGSPAPSPSPTVAGIDHPTGARDVVLRMEQGGGFVNPEFVITNGPLF